MACGITANALHVCSLALLAVLAERGFGPLQLLFLYLASLAALVLAGGFQTRLLAALGDAFDVATDEVAAPVDDLESAHSKGDDAESLPSVDWSDSDESAAAPLETVASRLQDSARIARLHVHRLCDDLGLWVAATHARLQLVRLCHGARLRLARLCHDVRLRAAPEQACSERGVVPAALALALGVCAAILLPLSEAVAVAMLAPAIARAPTLFRTSPSLPKAKAKVALDAIGCVSLAFASITAVALLVVPQDERVAFADALVNSAALRRARVKHVVGVLFASAAVVAAAAKRLCAARRVDAEESGSSHKDVSGRCWTSAFLSKLALPPLPWAGVPLAASAAATRELAVVGWAALVGLVLLPFARPLGLGASPPGWLRAEHWDLYASSAGLLTPRVRREMDWDAAALVVVSATTARLARWLTARASSRVPASGLVAISLLRIPLAWIVAAGIDASGLSLRGALAGVTAVLAVAFLCPGASPEPGAVVRCLDDTVPLLEPRRTRSASPPIEGSDDATCCSSASSSTRAVRRTPTASREPSPACVIRNDGSSASTLTVIDSD